MNGYKSKEQSCLENLDKWANQKLPDTEQSKILHVMYDDGELPRYVERRILHQPDRVRRAVNLFLRRIHHGYYQ